MQTTVGPGYNTSFAISEPTYTGTFTLNTNCAGIATIGQPSRTGPSSASVSVTGIAPGTCSVTITDAHGQSIVEGISVSTAAGNLN
jgi:hypothetical protein